MPGLRDTLNRLGTLRRDLAKALDGSEVPAGFTAPRASALLGEVASFGSNPGRLRMLQHVPAKRAERPALLVALHGCTQSAAAYDTGAGWSELADRHGFVTLFPEQQAANNPQRCFNWFNPAHNRRDHGEALSIRQMIDRAVSDHAIDRDRIFVTGLSAGGAMAASLLAAYPDVFAAGAIVAGLPCGSAHNVSEALSAMSKGQNRTPRQWGDLVRGAAPRPASWPRLSVWHGSRDTIVHPHNAEAIAQQWTDLHGVALSSASDVAIRNHRTRTWSNAAGRIVVEAHEIDGMGHGVPLAVSGERKAGSVGPYNFDVGVASSSHILDFFDVTGPFVAAVGAPAEASAGAEPVTEPRVAAEHTADTSGDGIFDVLRKAGVLNDTLTGRRRSPPLPHDVHRIITAALKSAGLQK